MYKSANPLSYAAAAKNEELLKNVLKYTGGAALGGFGIGSLASLIRHYRRPDLNDALEDGYGEDIDVPFVVKKKKDKARDNFKVAGVLQDFTDKLRSGVKSMTGNGNPVLSGNISDKINILLRDHPWVIPTAAVSIPAAGLLGYSAANSLGDNFKKQQDEEDLEEAKKEYENALLGKMSGGNDRVKKASVLGDIVDNASEGSKVLLSLLQNPSAAYTAFAVPAGALGAYYGYSKYKDANRKAVANALKRRAQIRDLGSPPPIHIMPRKVEEDDSEN